MVSSTRVADVSMKCQSVIAGSGFSIEEENRCSRALITEKSTYEKNHFLTQLSFVLFKEVKTVY